MDYSYWAGIRPPITLQPYLLVLSALVFNLLIFELISLCGALFSKQRIQSISYWLFTHIVFCLISLAYGSPILAAVVSEELYVFGHANATFVEGESQRREEVGKGKQNVTFLYRPWSELLGESLAMWAVLTLLASSMVSTAGFTIKSATAK